MTLSSEDHARLSAGALRVRERALTMTRNGGCFLGAALSCVDILVYLYDRVLRVAPETRHHEDRDCFFLSKGHSVPALYGVLVDRGYLSERRLTAHLDPNDSIYWHPSRSIPGIEFHSGSLGHLPSIALGVAIEARMRGSTRRAFVLVGDGELDEGSVWESLLVASAYQVDNLIVIVDRNEFQANDRTESLIALEPLEAKFESFGARTERAFGHDFDDLERAFSRLPIERGKPTVVVCDTVRGKGLPSIEARTDRWFCSFTTGELAPLREELHRAARATFTTRGTGAR